MPRKKKSKVLQEYQAFDAKDKLKRLVIRQAKGMWHSPAYAYLLDIITDGERGEEIALIFSFMLVKIRGRNLRLVSIAILKNDCDFIQEFDASEFIQPEPDEPIIESIEVVAKERD